MSSAKRPCLIALIQFKSLKGYGTLGPADVFVVRVDKFKNSRYTVLQRGINNQEFNFPIWRRKR